MIDRKASVTAYKERKAVCGIYRLHCAASGRVWVGFAGDMEKIRNRLDFTLRTGSSPHRSLQEDWRSHGEAAFSFAVMETREEEDDAGFARDAWRKARLAYWRDELGAEAI